jgi:CheY-like chemotaxis protein
MARITAIAATCTLAFSLLLRTDALQLTQQRLLGVVDASCALDVHYARAQSAVDVAMETSASEEPQLLYERHRDNLTRGLDHLTNATALLTQEELDLAVRNLGDVVVAHHRWCRDALQALSVRAAAWGDAEASGRAESRARSAHQESRLGYQRGLLALESLRRAVVIGMQRNVDGLRSARSTMFALIIGLALLGLAFSLDRPDVQERAEQQPHAPRLRGRVLIVDESPARRSLVQDVLAQSDAELDVADGSVAPDELMTSGRYDLVLLDMLFPGIDAYATAQRLHEEHQPTPVVAMSGEREACLAAGCAEHLASPIHPDALRAVLERHLRG